MSEGAQSADLPEEARSLLARVAESLVGLQRDVQQLGVRVDRLASQLERPEAAGPGRAAETLAPAGLAKLQSKARAKRAAELKGRLGA